MEMVLPYQDEVRDLGLSAVTLINVRMSPGNVAWG
jgi:hypothetical protein